MNKTLLLGGIIAGMALFAEAAPHAGVTDQFVPGEVIVKFKDESPVLMKASAKGRFATSGVKSLDRKLANLGVQTSDALMPMTGQRVSAQKLRTLNGSDVTDVALSKLYVLKFEGKTVAQSRELIEQLNTLDEVEYAEPNYILRTCTANYTTDPLYLQQWGIPAIHLDKLWQQKTISDRPIIAILDTGIDIDHPDLKDNIYTNTSELHGYEGMDDDNNGFIDDIHGWDFINETGKIADYNGHGTHCAGIAAASGGNGIGLSGANPDAWILPVTVMQSNGTGDVATIIKGIDYAAAIGADVISMSFGSYSHSLALEQALGKAYSKSVLVAAAGNDGLSLYPPLGAAMFPAAYSFVLGVQATNSFGQLASFSNYDPDGPIFSAFGEESLYNYEVKAPGTSVMSTYPNGQYKILNGTSMACPLVAGAISRLLQCKSYGNKETLFSDIIHASGSKILDIFGTYNITDANRIPTLTCVGYTLCDTIFGDKDMRIDAGETVDIYPTLRNEWGLAQHIKIWMTMGELEDASLVSFLNTDTVDFGTDLNSYAKAQSLNPLRIKVSDKTNDGRIIKLQIHATCDNVSSELAQNIELTVENGVELGGIIEEDMTLEPNVHYIVTSNLGVPEGVTLTINPGTVLKFKEATGISVAKGGYLNAIGEPGNMITFEPEEHSSGFWHGITGDITETNPPYPSVCNSNILLKYVTIRKFRHWSSTQWGMVEYVDIENCIFNDNYALGPLVCASFLQRSILLNNITNYYTTYIPYFRKVYYENGISSWQYADQYNAIINNYFLDSYYAPLFDLDRDANSSIFNNWDSNWLYEKVRLTNVYWDVTSPQVYTPDRPNYWGSSKESTVRKSIFDMYNPYGSVGFAKYDLSNMLTRPDSAVHGCVWKVVVNGYDAQDEFDLLPPLGVGRHKFEVYFNRHMNTNVAPSISMGVRAPYTQTFIGEDGAWNEDGDVYTAYVTIHGKADIDGTNRIYVYGAEDDEYFPCPEEQDRFNVNVQAAGSMSTGFMAEAGVGRVDLTWESADEDIDDILGYNIYRYTLSTDGTHSDTVRINTRLLDGEKYTDYNVIPGMTYYYYYKVMSTGLDENSPSKVVAATPLSSSKGDANGSQTVDVADIVTEVSFMLGQDPQPFLFEAADVNSDEKINVLDVVGTVNLIKQATDVTPTNITEVPTATYTISNGILYVDATVDLGGVQVLLSAPRTTTFEAMDALNGFEQVGTWQNNNGQYLFLAFSMTGKTIPAGRTALLKVGEDSQVDEIILSDARGQNILSVDGSVTGISTITKMQLAIPNPNPFHETLNVPYLIGQDGTHQVTIELLDLSGRILLSYRTIVGFGTHTHTFNTDALVPGLYLLNLRTDEQLMQTVKVIKL